MRGFVLLWAMPLSASITITSSPAPPLTGTVGSAFSVTFTATGGTPPYTWSLASGNSPFGTSLSGGAIVGTPTGCSVYPPSCANVSEPITSNFTIKATDSLLNSGSASFSIGIYWNPTEQTFLMNSQINNVGMVAQTVASPPPITVGGHLTIANPIFRQSSTDTTAMWDAFIDGMYVAGMRRLNIEPDLDCIYRQTSSCLTLYSSALAHARSLGMSISINPEYSGAFDLDCNAILGYPINTGPTPPPGYASGVSDWYTCLTNTSIAGLNGLSIYQWIVVNWLQTSDTFVVLHEPTSMASRWGEGTAAGGCQPISLTYPTGNTCPADWLDNFLYGGGTGAGGGTNPGSNDIIDHVLDCASRAMSSPCRGMGLSIGITIGVTTWLAEDEAPGYAAAFSPGLQSTVPMGLDMYFFGSSDLTVWNSAIHSATTYSHPTFVEEFAMQRWVQSGFFGSEANAIKGALSCDWEPPFSYNLANFLSAFLPWIAGTGATSASMFDPEVMSACDAVYPDNVGDLTVLNNAAVNFMNRSYSAASYRSAAIIGNWNRSAASGSANISGGGKLH